MAVMPRFLRPYWARLEASPLGYRLAKGCFWSLAGALIARTLAILASILLARILGKKGFGELGIIQSTVGMFTTFAAFGLSLTVTKHVAEFRLKDPSKAARILALSSVTALITGSLATIALVVSGPWLAANTLAAPNLAGMVQLSAVLLFLSAIGGIQTGALSGFESFESVAWANFISGVAAFPLMVGGTWICGLKGAVWGLVVSYGVNVCVNHCFLHREMVRAHVPFDFHGFTKEWVVLCTFSLPLILCCVGPVIATWICNVVLANQPGGYAEIGVFNAASQWRAVVCYLPNVLGVVVLPMLASVHAAGQIRQHTSIIFYNIMATGVIAISVAIPLCVFSAALMRSYGSGFAGRGAVLTLLACSAVFGAVTEVIGQSLMSRGEMWKWAAVCTFGAGVLVLVFGLLELRDAYGLARATMVAALLNLVFSITIAFWRSRRGDI